MGVDRRRAGFRLPWTADGEQTQDAQDQAADTGGDEAARAEMEAPPRSDSTAVAEVASASEAPPASGTDSETAATGTDSAVADSSGAEVGDATTEDPAAAAPSTPTESSTATGSDSTEFLASLVGAMRGVAESSRDASLAELRTAIDQRIAELGTKASEREGELRRTADGDIDGVAEWERTESQRIKNEADAKREARRARLEHELTEHRAASERAVEDARSRLAQHERDLAAFFAQLTEITDPAAFVAAAKRMPRAPDLDDETPAVTASEPSAGQTSPAFEASAAPTSHESATTADAPATAEAADAAATAEEPPATTTSATDPRLAALGVTPAEPEAATNAGEGQPSTNGTTPPGDAQLAERLAQLDQRLADAPAQPAVTSGATGADTSTAIVVKGLGSFGAITSFKQALERVPGVRGVTLSLGPTGEFVYRASHAGDFDLSGAIQGLEGPTATIDDTDGTLVVTLSRAR